VVAVAAGGISAAAVVADGNLAAAVAAAAGSVVEAEAAVVAVADVEITERRLQIERTP